MLFRRRVHLALALLLVGMAVLAQAQDYPSRFIRVIVGPGPDIVARVFGPKITEVLGQQVVIEPRPGAGGVIAAQTVATATPDGYTLLLSTASYAINTALQTSPIDMRKDFAPVGRTSVSPFILVVHPSVPVRTLGELIALAKSKPGQLNYASSGIGTPPHMAGELFKTMADDRHRACPVPRGQLRAQRRGQRRRADDVLDFVGHAAAGGCRHRARTRGDDAQADAAGARPAVNIGFGTAGFRSDRLERLCRSRGNAGGHRQ